MIEFHPKELKGTGLCPRDFVVIDGRPRSPSVMADEATFHPDDLHRESHYEDHRDVRVRRIQLHLEDVESKRGLWALAVPSHVDDYEDLWDRAANKSICCDHEDCTVGGWVYGDPEADSPDGWTVRILCPAHYEKEAVDHGRER